MPISQEAFSLIDLGWRNTIGYAPGQTITYTFFEFGEFPPADYSSSPSFQDARYWNGFTPFSTAQRLAVRQIFDLIEQITTLRFVEASPMLPSAERLAVANIRFGNTLQTMQSGGVNFRATVGGGYSRIENDILISSLLEVGATNPTFGLFGFYALIHEIGHALGLGHPPGIPSQAQEMTAMQTGSNMLNPYPLAMTPLIWDTEALQYLYGANTAWASSDSTYVFVSASRVGDNYLDPFLVYLEERRTIWDAGGDNDWIIVNYPAERSATISLVPGTLSSIGATRNIGIAVDVVIENAKGGDGSDLIYGNDANNTLEGRGGNDYLAGKAGFDTYEFQASQGPLGLDTISDSDGSGRIRINGQVLAGSGTATTSALWKDAQGYSYYFLPDAAGVGTLYITGVNGIQVNVLNFTNGQLGISLTGAPEPFAPQTTLTIAGDLAPVDADLGTPGVQFSYDALDNVIVDQGAPASDRPDVFYDSPQADLILAKGGDDWIEAWRGGNDRLEGGAGRDTVQAGPDRDVVLGGAGADRLFGDAGDDLVFAGDESPISNLYVMGEAQSPSGQQGDWADGGTGDDMVVGDAGDDVILGAAGADALYGGGGADNIFGDLTTNLLPADWTITRVTDVQPEVTYYRVLFSTGVSVTEDAAGGADTLHGGAGVDWLFAGNGDDYVDGGADDDVAFGGQGDDVALGGSGADSLSGDTPDDPNDPTDLAGNLHGSDSLSGGAGADELFGNGGDDWLFGEAENDNLVGDDALTPGEYHGADYLDGGAGADQLWGDGKDDVLIGGTGNDHLEGDYSTLDGQYHGADYLEGGDGDDVMFGQGGADELWGGAGDDTMAGDGPGVLAQYEGADWLFGEDGADGIQGNGGDDYLDGGSGTDHLRGGDGRDTLVGGADGDTLEGGPGDDILVVDGADTIIDTQGNNTIVFGGLSVAGLTLNSATDGSGNQYLTLTDAASTTIAIQGGFLSAVNAFETGEGLVDLRTLIASVQVNQGFTINGTAQADIAYGARLGDTLDGKQGDDSLEGGLGADTLIGGEGNDTYRFARGDGADTIDNTDPGPTAVDTLRFTTGILTTDVVLTRNGDNLVVQIRDTADQVTVLNHFTTAPIDQIVFDDATTWDQAAIASRLVSALTTGPDNYTGTSGDDFIQALAGNDAVQGVGGDDYIDGGPGFDNLYGGLGNDVIVGGADGDNLYGQAGNDVLNGGAGTDYLDGNTGNDTFEFARGGEQDTVLAYDTTVGAIDKLKLAADILPGDVFLRRDTSNHLVLTVNGTADRVTVTQHFTNTNYAIDQIVFDNGTVWDAAVINAKVLEGTANADYLVGYATDDMINGLAGGDTIYGNDGSDTIDGGADGDWIQGGLGSDALQGGAGADTIYGEDGNDTIDAGADGDSVQGGAGDDSLRGGTGTDTVYGDAGSDTFHYAAGDGIDTLYNNDASTLTTDTLVFGTGILPANLVLTRANTNFQDLVITFSGASGQLTIPDYFTTGSAGAIDEIRFADQPATVWTVASVKAALAPAPTEGPDSLVGFDTSDTIDGLGGDDSINGLAGDDTLRGGSGKDTLTGGAGGDQLDGGTGDDMLRGGTGNDTYLFGRGGGYDRIEETTGSDGADTLRLNAGVAPADVTLYRHADDLVVTISGDPAQLWIAQYFTLANKPTEQIVFDDATVWDSAAIASRVITGTQNAMSGTAGNDTFLVDHVGDTITEGANQGTDTVQSWVTYTLPANVENLTLTGILHVNATGNSLPNTITGNAGDNVLDGGYDQETDVLSGGAGNDSYLIGNGYSASSFDTVVEAAGGGVDTVFASTGDYTLEANVENLVMTSNQLVVRRAIGNALDNVISIDPWAGSGHEYLIDGGLGADRMIGGTGEDTYVVDNVGDIVVEEGVFAGGGQYSTKDGVKSAIDYVLGANLENLELQAGSGALIGTGNALNNSLAGNGNANTLTGLAGNDVLFGDMGVDTLIGGAGDDTYILADYRFLQSGQYVYANVSPASINEDTIVELAGEGTDTVKSLFDYTLGDTLENLELLKYTGGSNPIIPVQAIGNALANRLTGNDGDNVIDGRAGADVMDGGSGNDTYYVDDVGDVVVESPYAGASTADTVISEVSYALGTAVENLTLVGPNALTGAGNELNNALDGTQSAAANTLTGGAGDDTYFLGAGDTAVENGGEGVDTVYTGESYTLGPNVENLVLTGSLATTGTGDSGDNTLDGSQNSAANTLIGGLGNDTYFVDGGDLIVENPGEGTDTVVASFNYTLTANLENLTLAEGVANGTGNAGANVLTGNYSDNVLDGAGGADTLRGSSGNDTYVVDDAGDVVDETDPVWGGDAGGTDTVRSAVSYTLGNYLENLVLTGSAATTGTGNSLDNTLDGAQNAAANTLAGGTGNDTYVVDGADVVVENAGEGTDTVQSASTVTLGANVENLVLIGTGAVNGTGNSAANSLTGNSAANTLDGGTGADTMIGGAGDDTYVVDNTSDVVTENANEGVDTILSSITRTLPNNVENLTLTGSSAINGTGNSLANVLRGNSAVNTLSGGSGNDSYYVSTGDTVTESSGQGTDTVYSDVTWTLGSNLENLTLLGTANINATGNTLANVLTGNSGNNTLSGGSGADTMAGGAGDDTYVVDNTSDAITESAGSGTDLVQSSVTYTLSAEVENLTLTGTSAINGTGNASNNTLTGNSANNTLTGNGGDDWLDGGSGSDTMRGGLGNDTYVVAQTGDVVTENANEGTDTVRSSITYTLGSNVENLILTGTTAINGTGNTVANVLTGNSANNTLTGGAGDDWLEGLAGTDTMVGGTGNDTYVVADSTDVVTENANEGTDTVRTSITYTLGSNVENVILTGTAALNATGNTLNNALTGNSGNNSLTGNAGADTLDGDAGTDTLTGGTGNDTYLLGRGHGADTIVENDSTGGNTDIARFLAGVANDQVWFRQVGNNLEASIIGTSDLFVAKDWYLGTQYRVEQFNTTDGNRTLLQGNVQNLVNAMAAFSPPPPGQTTLPPEYQAALNPVIAANWQ